MNKYGIYICFPPGVDLRHEGLGRYLAAFIKGAEKRKMYSLHCYALAGLSMIYTNYLRVKGYL